MVFFKNPNAELEIEEGILSSLGMGFIPKVNVNKDNSLRIISGWGKLFLIEEHIH